MKNTIILLILFAASLKGYSRDVPDTTVPFSTIPIYYSSNQDSDRIIGLVSLGNGLWANKTFWAIDLKRDRLRIADTSTMLSALWSAINNKQANFTLTTTGSSGAATLTNGTLNIPVYTGGGTQYNLNNEVYYGVKWVSGQAFTMPSTPTRFYYVQVVNSTTPTALYASYTWTSGTSVTVNDALQTGDSLVFHYDAGVANGTIAGGTPSNGYVPIWNSTSGQAVWGAQSGGSTGGPTSISLATPNVLYSTPVTYNNDGSGNWTATLSLISQAAHKVFASPLASTGTPIFRSVDSADFGGTGQFAAEVQAVPGFGTGSGGVSTVGTFNSTSYVNGANITGSNITFGPADFANPGMVTTGTQSFGGVKSWFGKQTGLTGTNGYGYGFFPDINVTSGTTNGVLIAMYDSASSGGTRNIINIGSTNAANGGGTLTSYFKIATDGGLTVANANHTIGGNVQFNGTGFGASWGAGNFYCFGSTNPGTGTLTNDTYFGTNAAQYRITMGNKNPSANGAPAGDNLYGVHIGTSSMYVSTTGGTHPLAANLVVDTGYVADPTAGTRGTVARIATVFINGGSVKNALESSQPFSLWIGGTGVFRNDNGVIPGSRTTVADANYTVSINDYNVVFTSLSATRSVTPPANPQTNQHWKIKDESGAAATNNITFVGTLDGATNPTLISANYGAKTIYYNGTAWFSE